MQRKRHLAPTSVVFFFLPCFSFLCLIYIRTDEQSNNYGLQNVFPNDTKMSIKPTRNQVQSLSCNIFKQMCFSNHFQNQKHTKTHDASPD